MKSIKDKFLEWIKLKKEIHFSESNFSFREKQIWWASLGQNVGSEENGKNENFERPVLILKKINRNTIWVLPTSSKVKEDKYHYTFKRKEKEYSVKLSQIRLLSNKRLIRFIDNISKDDFMNIKKKIKELM